MGIFRGLCGGTRLRRRMIAGAGVGAVLAAALPVLSLPAVQATTRGCPAPAELWPGGCVVTMRADGTWTVPDGITEIDVMVVGGGGGGGNAYIDANGPVRSPGGGGGGGAVVFKAISVTPGQVFTATLGAGGAPGAAGQASSAVSGATSVTAAGGGAGQDGTAAGAGGGGGTSLSLYANATVTFGGGSSLFTTEPATGQLGGAGGGAGAGQRFAGRLAEVGGEAGGYIKGSSLNAQLWTGNYTGVGSGFGGNGYQPSTGRLQWFQYSSQPWPNGTRITHFGAGGGGGTPGDTRAPVTSGGSTLMNGSGLYPGPSGNGGLSYTSAADAAQDGAPRSGGGGGGGAAMGLTSASAQAGGSGGSGMVAFAFDPVSAGLTDLRVFSAQAQYDTWAGGGQAAGLSLAPTFSATTREYELEVPASTTDLWLGLTPLAGGTIASVTASGNAAVTSLAKGASLSGVEVGSTMVTVAVESVGGVVTETYTIEIVAPQAPPGPGSRALAWGYGSDGALGIGNDKDKYRPVQVLPGANTAGTWKEIAGGYDSSCGIGTNDRLYCWGSDSDGQLATNGGGDTLAPAASVGGDNTANSWKALSIGYSHACGIGTDTKVYCWGYNNRGQVGKAGASDQLTPYQVSPDAGWSVISAGDSRSCGLKGTTAYCWGYGGYGERGDGTRTDSTSPVAVLPGANTAGTWSAISTGEYHTCGLGLDGTAYCWGNNSYGEVGDGSTPDYRGAITSPVQVLPGANTGGKWKSIVAGSYVTCGIGIDDKAYCWGGGSSGELGNGADTDSGTPVRVQIPGSEVVTSLTTGYESYYVCALTASSKVYCWGYNSYGALGDGTDNDSNLPVLLALPEPLTPGVPSKISAGAYHMTMLATYPTLPGAPTITGTTVGNAGATVQFTAGTPGSSATTNYEYRIGTGPWVAVSPASTATSITITGLTNGQAELIRVRAVSAQGGGAASNAVSVTPIAPPGAPTITGAVPLNGRAEIAFTDGTAGTLPTTNYQYRLGNGAWTALSPPTTTSPLIITGLTNGTGYSISIRAVTSGGAGAASAATSVTPFSLPGAPTISEAAPRDGGAELSFAPGLAGSSRTTNYEYQLDGGNWVALSPAKATSPVLITGLTNGQTYSVKLRAVTVNGVGVESSAASVTPAIVPGAPTITAVTRQDGALDVAFTAATPGTAPITNYQYQLNDGIWWSLNPASTTSPFTITGLTNGVRYAVRLRAVSADGNGAFTDPTAAVPGILPGAPTVGVVTPGNRSARVTFTPGASGSPATSNYEYQLDGGAWRPVSPADASSPVTITGLVNGRTYSVKIRAVNAVGPSGESSAFRVTPEGSGPEPEPVKPGRGQILIDGAAVASTVTVNEGRTRVTLEGAGVQMDLKGRSSDGERVPVDGSGALVLEREGVALVSGEGMKPGTQVKLFLLSTPRLLATTTTNARGEFRGSGIIPSGLRIGSHVVQAVGITPSGKELRLSLGIRVLRTTVIAPSQVRSLAARAGLWQAALSWQAPANSGGSPVTGYVLAYRSADVPKWTALPGSSSPSALVSGLQSGCQYEVRVAGVSAVGRGTWTSVRFAAPSMRALPSGEVTCRLR